MEIQTKIQSLFLKIKNASRLKLFVFSLFGVVILLLIIEGGYYFYLKVKSEELYPDGTKPSAILGSELAIPPYKSFQNPPKNGGDSEKLELIIGVRELPSGVIGIGGYFVGFTADSITLKVKEKEVTIETDSKVVWRKIDNSWRNTPKEERAPEVISPDALKEGDQVDIVCQKSEGGLKAIGILVVYN